MIEIYRTELLGGIKRENTYMIMIIYFIERAVKNGTGKVTFFLLQSFVCIFVHKQMRLKKIDGKG